MDYKKLDSDYLDKLKTLIEEIKCYRYNDDKAEEMLTVEYDLDLSRYIDELEDDYADELEEMIDDIKDDYGNKRSSTSNMELFNLLCEIVPRFNGFTLSEQDDELIDDIRSSKLDSGHIARKILKNARDVIDGRKDVRFGSLFVGLKEINGNCKRLFS